MSNREWIEIHQQTPEPKNFGDVTKNATESSTWEPNVKVLEKADAVVLSTELTDISKEDLHVAMENRVLTIRGERKLSEPTEDYHRIEHKYGAFWCSFLLPESLNSNAARASLENGVLHIEIPREIKESRVISGDIIHVRGRVSPHSSGGGIDDLAGGNASKAGVGRQGRDLGELSGPHGGGGGLDD